MVDQTSTIADPRPPAERRLIERSFHSGHEVRVDEGEDGQRRISWYPAVFDSRSEDLGGFFEIIGRRAFTKTVSENDIRALFNHNPDYVLGRNRADTLDLKVDLKGLRASVMTPDTSWARDLTVSIERGDISSGSFQFSVLSDTWREDKETNEIVRILNEVRLYDVSLVTFPAYPATDGTVALRSALAGTGIDLQELTLPMIRARAGQPLDREEWAAFVESVERIKRSVPAPVDHAADRRELLRWKARLIELRRTYA